MRFGVECHREAFWNVIGVDLTIDMVRKRVIRHVDGLRNAFTTWFSKHSDCTKIFRIVRTQLDSWHCAIEVTDAWDINCTSRWNMSTELHAKEACGDVFTALVRAHTLDRQLAIYCNFVGLLIQGDSSFSASIVLTGIEVACVILITRRRLKLWRILSITS